MAIYTNDARETLDVRGDRGLHVLERLGWRPAEGGGPASQATQPEDQSGDAPGDSEDDSYEAWSKPELIKEAGARGLSHSGSKADLIGRLEEDDAQA
jgi:hypothetical protein